QGRGRGQGQHDRQQGAFVDEQGDLGPPGPGGGVPVAQQRGRLLVLQGWWAEAVEQLLRRTHGQHPAIVARRQDAGPTLPGWAFGEARGTADRPLCGSTLVVEWEPQGEGAVVVSATRRWLMSSRSKGVGSSGYSGFQSSTGASPWPARQVG